MIGEHVRPNEMKEAWHDFEPLPDFLVEAAAAFTLELLEFDPVARKLDPDDFLARYHAVRFRIRCRKSCDRRPLFPNVRRHGSKIAAANFYTVPFHAEVMVPGDSALYELLSFDSFNLPFRSLSIELCAPEDYRLRRVSAKHVERARAFARFY